jgi:hypothetical protein
MSNNGVTLTIPCGDYGYDINFVLTNADCTAFDLTGYTLKLKMWKPGKPKDLLVDGTITITTPPGSDGLAYYTIVSGNFDIAGSFVGEVEGTKAGIKISWKTFDLVVSESG